MSPVERPGGGETGNVIGASMVLASAIADLGSYPGAVYPVLIGAICGFAGWTFARWQAWERAVVVDVVETTVLADSDDAKPPEGP